MSKTHRKPVDEKSKRTRHFKRSKQDIHDEQDFLYEDEELFNDDFDVSQQELADKIQEKTTSDGIPCFREGEDLEFDKLLNKIFGDPE